MNILIVGVGLIGGSFSLALKKRKKEEHLFGGFDTNKKNLARAKKLGIIDHDFDDYAEAIAWAHVVVLSLPVKGIHKVLSTTLDLATHDKIIVDFASTKETICSLANAHKNRSLFIASHPIAGTEHSGPDAAFQELFENQNLIICDAEKSDPHKLSTFIAIAKTAGFYITKMTAKEHDYHLAFISHLSHISSYTLSNTVLKEEEDGKIILGLAGSGFESTVRLAKSSPEMWSSIFLDNKKRILEVIKAYKHELISLEEMIENHDEKKILAYLKKGRKIRKILG